MSKRKKRSAGPPKFKVGDRVRVKHGVADPFYPDIPLGGWAGVVAEVFRRRRPEYLLEWTEETLQNAHPVFKKRCLRDGASFAETCLKETDLEPDRGEPLSVEQPTNLVTEPLSPDDQGDRVRAVFGLTSDDPLPEVDEESQQRYCDWLKEHLQFPFDADYWGETEAGSEGMHRVTVIGISEEFPVDECDGVICEAREGDRRWEVSLCELEVEDDHPNAQPIDDYGYWFWETFSQDELDDYDLDEDDLDEDWVETLEGEFDDDEGGLGQDADSLDDDAHAFKLVDYLLEVEHGPDEDDLGDDGGVSLDEADLLPPPRVEGREEPGRNDPCPCGSGKKYKHCCLQKQKARATFPIGSVALYGPDDKTTTKVVAAVITEEGAEPILERWMGTNVTDNPKVQRGIQEFFQQHQVKSTVVNPGNMGCPHEEGEDFPVGGDCPFCPFWKGKQGSGRKR